ncbi:Hypothetical_protein [Hexamita inflata]|uniref:Hypothetical_protein n=1 Tax=Hexamita inflata TaxID=28002 RepID=A0AA86N6Y8_9EUKA|nr:Hypothetical protein HINF_LOCUS1842 [Hexamita inflata]
MGAENSADLRTIQQYKDQLAELGINPTILQLRKQMKQLKDNQQILKIQNDLKHIRQIGAKMVAQSTELQHTEDDDSSICQMLDFTEQINKPTPTSKLQTQSSLQRVKTFDIQQLLENRKNHMSLLHDLEVFNTQRPELNQNSTQNDNFINNDNSTNNNQQTGVQQNQILDKIQDNQNNKQENTQKDFKAVFQELQNMKLKMKSNSILKSIPVPNVPINEPKQQQVQFQKVENEIKSNIELNNQPMMMSMNEDLDEPKLDDLTISRGFESESESESDQDCIISSNGTKILRSPNPRPEYKLFAKPIIVSKNRDL